MRDKILKLIGPVFIGVNILVLLGVLLLSRIEPAQEPLRVLLTSWHGYAGLFAANGNIYTEENSIMAKQGLNVHIDTDDLEFPQLANLSKIPYDCVWGTIGSFLSESGDAKIVMLIDQSVGADRIIARSNVQKMRGSRAAFIPGTSNEILLRQQLALEGLTINDIVPVKTANNEENIKAVQVGQADVAAAWDPDTVIALWEDKNLKQLTSSRDFDGLIQDTLICSNKSIKAKREQIQRLINGWLIGNEMPTSNLTKAIAKGQVKYKQIEATYGSDRLQGLFKDVHVISAKENKERVASGKLKQDIEKLAALFQLTVSVDGMVDTSFIENASTFNGFRPLRDALWEAK